MITKKQLLLTLITLSSLHPKSLKADTPDGLLAALAGGAIAIAAGCGIYTLCERASFKHAQNTLTQCQDALQERATSYKYTLNPHQLVQKHRHDLNAYEGLCTQVNNDVRRLQEIGEQLKAIKNNWGRTSYARDLVDDARQSLKMQAPLLEIASEHKKILDELRSIIVLETMFTAEERMKFARIIASRRNNSFDTAVTNAYAQSQWPYLQAQRDISERRKEYQREETSAGRYARDFSDTLAYARTCIEAYLQAEERIIQHPRYTEDQRYKQQYDNDQERLRLEREKAQAAQRQAEAAQKQAQAAQQQAEAARQQAYASQRQADALAQQNIQQLKNRLLELRMALNNTRAEIDRTDYYWEAEKLHNLQCNYNLLRAEALSIRNQLYGYPDIIQLFVDIFSTRDYIV